MQGTRLCEEQREYVYKDLLERVTIIGVGARGAEMHVTSFSAAESSSSMNNIAAYRCFQRERAFVSRVASKRLMRKQLHRVWATVSCIGMVALMSRDRNLLYCHHDSL